MASNSFGSLFRFTTWGESHGPAVGVVVDGCPAGIPLREEHLNEALARRAPGSAPFTTPRRESDTAVIQSGVFEGVTTGAPLSILIANRNADSSRYTALARLLRPGHANYTYLRKYGVFDHRGGGRASARETACRVAAGAVARRVLAGLGVDVGAFLSAVGPSGDWAGERETGVALARQSPLFAPGPEVEAVYSRLLAAAVHDGDSLGGVVTFVAGGVPAGLGDPVYRKLDALLAGAMMSIPAAKGVEIGEGFAAAALRGSVCNDGFTADNAGPRPATNRAGGILGGISTGLPVYGRVAFKPTPSIFVPQSTVDVDGNPAVLTLPEGSRHDPCVAIRAVPVVEAMALVVLADALLMQRATQNTGDRV